MSFKVGDTVGDYEVIGELGAGGMGRVYKVRNQLSQRVEAMKVLLSESLGTADQAERFLREIRVHASLEHPNIAALRTALRIDNQLVMIMEFVEGKTLHAMIERGPIYMKDAIDYMSQSLSALAYAHEHGVIHRDIKPANIMLTAEGVIKLMDFGIAKAGADRSLTAVGATMGSLFYMSPEQVKGGTVDGRSDLYSLGVTLYQAVTGTLPFQDSTDYAVLSAHLSSPPTPPRERNPLIPESLEKAILKAMAKEPAERFQNATEFRDALQKISGLPGEAAATKPIAIPDGAKPAPPTPSQATPRPTGSKSGTVEYAHVLFMDIVAYSQMRMVQQTERISQLVDIVRDTDQFKQASQSDNIISLPTGDGMALVFFHDPIAPVECATEVSRVLKTHPELKLRMGIHTGPVYRVADINTARNVAGGGINMAQRVMDCGDAGHILVSKTVADTLGQLSDDYSENLHDLGDAEVKHGVKVHIVNYYTSEVGNPEVPKKIQQSREIGTAVAQPVATPPPVPIPSAPAVSAAAAMPDAMSRPIPVPAAGSSKGVYIAVGVGVLALVLAAFGAKQFFQQHSESKQETNTTSPASLAPSLPSTPQPPPPPSSTDASVPPAAPPPASTPAAASAPQSSGTTPAKNVAQSRPPGQTVAAAAPPRAAGAPPAASAPAAQNAAAAEDKALLQEQRERMMMLSGRVAAVRGSLDNLQRQQAASGLGLRGDMAAAKGSMEYLMGEAKSSMSAGDGAGTKRNLDMAEKQVEKLEGFLGR